MEKWKKGMLVGAALGLFVSLIDRQEREKVKNYSKNMGSEIRQVYSQPSTAISQLRTKLNDVTRGTDRVIQQLNQLESFFNKYDNRK
ncbi:MULTISPECIES: hypothetical protein [Allobacillus]|uniref:YtxH domain-containing protein n=1 Tax=Allobacillus salarius TaxID=1955272 RepID=A0A556PP83_9BACI|nr:hypothetical protein [Allobacillus salarius]TSJ66200.1 hypothetical protein FPQ13_04830 [Allobacillus salarius]